MDKNQEQYHKILSDLLKLPENKECADCGAKGFLKKSNIFFKIVRSKMGFFKFRSFYLY